MCAKTQLRCVTKQFVTYGSLDCIVVMFSLFLSADKLVWVQIESIGEKEKSKTRKSPLVHSLMNVFTNQIQLYGLYGWDVFLGFG